MGERTTLKSLEFELLDAELLFSQVADESWSLFLDSGVTRANKHQRRRHADFDVIAIRPTRTMVFRDGRATITRETGTELVSGQPLDLLRTLMPQGAESHPLGVNGYVPGVIGYFSYDLGRYFEHLPNTTEDDEQLPELAAGFYPVIVVCDYQQKVTRIVFIDDADKYSAEVKFWTETITELTHQECAANHADPVKMTPWKCESLSDNLGWEDYQDRFARVKHYIENGDCYQVNLTKRFSARVSGKAWHTYVQLRNLSPAPYGAYLNFDFATVLSNSPESFIQCRGRRVVTSPIKGTRPRNFNSRFKDRQIADELVNSVKDRAENLMIVDLMRNDLSRCCELGSVKVPTLFALHSFANVHHLISTVVGTLREDLDAMDLLGNCFPGGSITGAPKIRAMEIIEELESNKRGLYCGSIGYWGVDGNLETNIAIRTVVHKDGTARFSAGGGLVLDSLVQDEYVEIADKVSIIKNLITGFYEK